MDIDQVNQMVAVLHYEIYSAARKEGKEIVDAFRIAECFIQEMKSESQEGPGFNFARIEERGLRVRYEL